MKLWSLRTWSLLCLATFSRGIRTQSTAELLRQVFFNNEEEETAAPSPSWIRAPPSCQANSSNASQLEGQPFIAPTTGTFIHGCSGKSLDVIMPCEVAPKEGKAVPVQPAIPWLLREMLGFFDLNVACLEDLHRIITSPSRAQQKLIAKYVHPGSVFILTSSKYSMGLDVAAQTQLSHLSLIHLGDLSSTWAEAYKHWGLVFRTFWTDDLHHRYEKLVKEGRLMYLPLGPTPQLLWHGVKTPQNASQRPVKIYFGGSSQQRQSRLLQAQKLLGKELVVESTSGSKIRSGYDQHYIHQLFSSAMCLQVPGPSIESFRLYESLEAGCIPVVVRSWSQGGDPLVKLQVGGEALPFLYVQAPEDLPQVLKLTGVQLDMLQAQCQAWWMRARQTFRARAVNALLPHRPSPSMRGLELKWWSGCVVLYLALCTAAMVFFGTQAKEASSRVATVEMSVEAVRLVLVMMIITDHFWLGSLQLQREECSVWKLLAMSGFLTARCEVRPWQRYLHHRFIGVNGRRLRWYLLAMAAATVTMGRPDVLCYAGLHTWQVPWHPLCSPQRQLQCPAYRWNAPLWPLPGLFLCWFLYPLISMALEPLQRLERVRAMPVVASLGFLLSSAGCYCLSMAFLDLPFQSFPPLMLAPFCFGVFAHEWLCTLKLNDGAVTEQWRGRLQMTLLLSLLLQQLIPGVPGGWNLPLLLPLFLPRPRCKAAMHSTPTAEADAREFLRSWVVKLGRCSPTCYMFQLPVAQLLLYAFEFLDCAGIAHPSQVHNGKVSAPYPQMKNYSFLIYLMLLWSVGLLSSRWPAPSD